MKQLFPSTYIVSIFVLFKFMKALIIWLSIYSIKENLCSMQISPTIHLEDLKQRLDCKVSMAIQIDILNDRIDFKVSNFEDEC